MSMNGIDISSWQKDINLAEVPCEFVIIKATEGTSYVNPYCDKLFNQAEALGKKPGVYHFASGLNAKEEAEYFVKNVRDYIGKAILALDWEIRTAADRTDWAKEWLDRVYRLTGVKPFIYMSNYTAIAHSWTSVASSGYPLWNAYYYAYGTPMGYNPDVLSPDNTGAWSSSTIYQYTSEGRLEGYNGNLDLDIFYGTPDDWDNYARPEKETPTEPPAPETPPPPQRIIRYRVRFGDTLMKIARRYGTTVQALVQLNNIRNPNRIYAGQIIKVPVKSPGSTSYYTVQSGDTLSEIAEKFNTTTEKLQKLNDITDPNLIYPGQRLKIS